jgi:twinkle protein
MTLSKKHIEFLEGRCISLEVATAMQLYSGRRVSTGVEADPAGNILVYPYMENGVEKNAKYRAPGKRFWQKKDGKKLFWNRDVLSDPSLHDGSHPLVITEGENDALALITAGYPFVVSVPDGAPPARDHMGKLIEVPDSAYDIDPDNDDKYAFILNDWDLLARIKSIIIAVDSDEPGVRLAKELVRRLDRIRCKFVTYPDGCKDLNEVLEKVGPEIVMRVIKEAKPFPVSGVYSYSDLPDEAPIATVTTGWPSIDPYLMPYTPAFMVITGFPNHGKSTWAVQFATQLAMWHGWTVGIASFEMRIKPYVTNQIKNIFITRRMSTGGTPDARLHPDQFLERRFCFIAPDPEEDIVHDLEWLLDRMATAVIRHGMRVCIIDPWNEIDHRRERDESGTEYVGRAIRKLKIFAKRYDVLVIIVAHPDKSARNRDPEELGLADISDSAHWSNKADIGITIGRIGELGISTSTGVYITKIRYQPEAGRIGEGILQWDQERRMFMEGGGDAA